MFALLATVITASLLGSLHCAGMCGAFVAFAVGGPTARGRGHLQLAYHSGRLITYTLLGALAGFIGSRIDLGGSRWGMQRSAAIAAGAMMITIGLIAILRLLGARMGRIPVPTFLQTLTLAGHKAAAPLSPVLRALIIGLLTTLLPCGWLLYFVIWAGGTGSVADGALLMASFWLGTVPILAAMGLGIQQLTPRLRAYVPVLTASLLLLVGTWTLLSRGRGAYAAMPIATITPAAMIQQIRQADHHTAPCCQTRPAGSTQP